jgi:hypothetical protein
VFLTEGEREELILTQKFMVVENKLAISAKVKRGFPDEEKGGLTQKIEFTLKPKEISLQNPFDNLDVVIAQNRRTDNEKKHIVPTSVLPVEIRYEPLNETTFECGNEFRHFDIKDLKHQTEFINEIIYSPNGYFIKLKPGRRKTFDNYITEHDLNGRFLVRNAKDFNNPETESEYVRVSFFLPYKHPVGFGEIYISGQLTNWQLDDQSKLIYDFENRGYAIEMLLKQGYYEYVYVYKDDKENSGSVSFIEGNHFETNNEYMIYVYYKAPGTTYYQLVGNKLIYSHE